MFSQTNPKSFIPTALAAGVFLLIYFTALWMGEFRFVGYDGGFRWEWLIIGSVPYILTYLWFRCFLLRSTSLVLLAIAVSLLIYSNYIIFLHAGRPIFFSDLLDPLNLKIIIRYLTKWELAGLFIGSIALIFFIKRSSFSRRHPNRGLRLRNLGIASVTTCAYLLLPFAAASLSEFSPAGSERLKKLATIFEMQDASNSVRDRGVAHHLIVSSQRSLPMKGKKVPFEAAAVHETEETPILKNYNAVVIICEACFWDKKIFSELAEIVSLPSSSFVMRERRSLSPVYGGSTANFEFELDLGMSASQLSSDVIYRVYGDLFQAELDSPVRRLTSRGYSTQYFHNFDPDFFNRRFIKPKIGYEDSFFLPDMEGYNAENSGWPTSDKPLFDFVESRVSQMDEPFHLKILTVATHGPYGEGSTGPAEDYKTRVSETLHRIDAFVGEVGKLFPSTAFLVIGDHKPGLTGFFRAKGKSLVFDEGRDAFGDVPALWIMPKEADWQIASESPVQPVYCHSLEFWSLFLDRLPPQYIYTDRACNPQEYIDSDTADEFFESGLYRTVLFDD